MALCSVSRLFKCYSECCYAECLCSEYRHVPFFKAEILQVYLYALLRCAACAISFNSTYFVQFCFCKFNETNDQIHLSLKQNPKSIEQMLQYQFQYHFVSSNFVQA